MSSLAQVAQSLQQHASEEPENTADDDKSAPESMQLDDAPNVPAPQPADKPPATQATTVEVSAAALAAAHLTTATPVNKTLTIELSNSMAGHAADGPQDARTRLRVMKDSGLTDEQKLEQVKELTLAWDRPTMVSSMKLNSRST